MELHVFLLRFLSIGSFASERFLKSLTKVDLLLPPLQVLTMSFYIGECSKSSFRGLEIHKLSHIRDAEHLQDGDIVSIFGHVLQWDLQDCVSEETCKQWRAMGDPACDAAIETLFPTATSSVGKDLLTTLEQYVADNPGPNPAKLFLDEVSQLPPAGIQVSEEDVELGQAFFLDHAVQIMQALLHYSLAAGFASSQIVRTLQAVSYLVPPVRKVPPDSQTGTSSAQVEPAASDARTFTRLLETFQFVLDVMGCTAEPPPLTAKWGNAAYLMPGGEGWRSAVRVRMLHGVARRRARERLNKTSEDGAHEHNSGVPISQEDMSATLVSFSTVPIWALSRLHLRPSAEQTRAYLALWRHVGFYLGVSPAILTRYLHSTRTADKFLASIVLDLFSSPLALSTLPTVPILRAASHRAPAYNTLAHNIAVTRHLVGPALADHLGLPRTARWTQIKLHLSLFGQTLPVWFAAWYPRRAWRAKRRAVLREGIARSLRWNLGMRQVSFRPRTDVRVFAADGEGGEEDDSGGKLADGVKEAENVAPNPAAGRRLTQAWRQVLAEMVGVSICIVICICMATWWGFTSTIRYFTVSY